MSQPLYEVTDPKGVYIAGEHFKKGSRLPAGTTGAQVKAFLRFGQIEAVNEAEKPESKPEPEPEPSAEPETVEELKAALEERGVDFAPKAKKAELEELYKSTSETA